MLRAGLGWLGAARITLRLSDIPEGCRIEMIEVPAEGPMRLIPHRLTLSAIYPRNRECLLRLAAMVQRFEPSQIG